MSYHTTAPWEKSPAPQYFEKSPRQQSQFPSKYSHLPQIKSPSPHPMDSQLVPVNATDGKLRLGMRSSGHLDMEGDERIREMEMRLTVSEKSNRALLEEVLRLQNEIKSSGRRSDDILREERKARQDVETSIKVCSDLISQLTARIKTTEERVQEEKMTLSTLVNHTKGVEQVVLSSQHELLNKKAVQSTKLQELQTEVSSTVQAKNKLESLSYRLADDVHQLKSKVDSQGAEHQNIISDLKLRSKRLEEENRLQLDTMRKQTEAHTAMESQVTQLKGQVETRLSELRDVLVEVRNKQDTEVTERRNSEQHFQTRLSDLYQTMAEQNRKREESIHAVDIAIREKEHMAQTERMTLTTQVSDTVEEVNKKLLAKEIKIREELQDRFIQLEKMIQQEQHARRDHEKSMRDDNEKRWHALRKVQEEELHTVKDAMKSEKGKSKGTLQKLDDSISLLERQQHESKKQIDKVLAAEIQSRKIHEKNTAEHMASLNEKLQVATSTLQQAIGGINTQVANQLDKVRRDVKSIQGDQQQAMMRTMTDLDTRVVNQSKKITTLEEVLDAKVATASAALSQNLREKIESISLWQDATAQTIRELKHNVQSLPQDLYALEEKHKLLKAEIDSRMSAESEMRTQEIEMMKHDLQALKLRKDPRGPTIQDMEMMQSGVRKMADSIQTIKTVLGMKIQSEQKLRISGLEDLQAQINQLKVKAGFQPTFGSQAEYLRQDMDTGFETGFETQTPYGGQSSSRTMKKPLSPVNSTFGTDNYRKKGPPQTPPIVSVSDSPPPKAKKGRSPTQSENSPHQSPDIPASPSLDPDPDTTNQNQPSPVDWTNDPPQSPQGPASRLSAVSQARGQKSVTPTGSVRRKQQRSRQQSQPRTPNGAGPSSPQQTPSPRGKRSPKITGRSDQTAESGTRSQDMNF